MKVRQILGLTGCIVATFLFLSHQVEANEPSDPPTDGITVDGIPDNIGGGISPAEIDDVITGTQTD